MMPPTEEECSGHRDAADIGGEQAPPLEEELELLWYNVFFEEMARNHAGETE
jgi:hypothetical protein